MNKVENFSIGLTEVEEIKNLRKQLAEFNPIEGNLEVIFTLPDGKSVGVPIKSKVKVRLLSKEIRNYLAEEQLLQQCKED